MELNAALSLLLALLAAGARAEVKAEPVKDAVASPTASPRNLAAPVQAPASLKPASEAFVRLAEDYWDLSMRLDPLSASYYNYPRYHDRLADNSPAGRVNEKAELAAILRRLEAIDRSQLPETDKVSWDIMKLEIDMALEQQNYKFWQWNVAHMDGPQDFIPTIIQTAQPMKTAADAKAFLARVKAVPTFFANHIANLREGFAEGRVAAQAPVRKTISQLEDFLKMPADETPYAGAAKKLPPELQKEYLPQAVRAVKDSVFPAYASYLKFLKEEYLAKARPDDTPGLSYLPGGKEAYRWAIRYHTTLDKTPEELHQTGLDELKDIRAEMAAIARKMGHQGDLPSFIDKIRHDPANFFTTREQVEQAAKDFVAKAYAKLPQYFGILPKTPLEVKRTEDYREKNAVSMEYYEVPDDLSRPGVFYVNTYEPKTRSRFDMPATAAHEGVPGHHLQIAIAAEQRGLPAFRRHAGFNAYIEGWALYSERLADEMGLYPDDLSRVGMLSNQAFRAARLAVDTGLHAFGWSRKRAIDFMKANTPMSEEEITTEVDRYIIWPGQALAYKTGQREIMALRKQSQERLKDKFDLRAFHDSVLKNGAVPLPTLRREILGGM